MGTKTKLCLNPALYLEEGRNVEGCLCKEAKEYGDTTSIHGIKYITESGRLFCERYARLENVLFFARLLNAI